MRPYLLALVALSCVRTPPRVSQDELAEVPPEVVSAVAPMRAEAADLEHRIATAETTLDQQVREEQRQADRVDALEDAIRGNRELKRIAVERGDSATASEVDEQLAQYDVAYDQARTDLAVATREREITEGRLALWRAERDLVLAEIELTQAQAVAETSDVRLARFERAVNRARERRDEAARALKQLYQQPAPAA